MSEPRCKFEILHRPDFAFLHVRIPAGATLQTEATAMATMSTGLKLRTKLRGGLGRLVTGESVFLSEYTAEGSDGELGLAPRAPGDIEHVNVRGKSVYLQSTAFLAATAGVRVESQWQGVIKGFFSRQGLFLIRCSGEGDLWFNSYGALIPIDVDGNYTADTGFVVAFEDGLDYELSPVAGLKSLLVSGEGFVCRFSGKGRLWLQTRQAATLAHWVHPFRTLKSGRSTE